MFTKLRNRFLIVNLVTISVLMFIAFASIYAIMYRQVQNDIHMELREVTESNQKPRGNTGDAMHSGGMFSGREPMMDGETGMMPDRSVSFVVRTDREGNILSSQSKFDMDEEFFTAALKKASSVKGDTGQFELDGSRWIFKIQPAKDGFLLVFLDVTARHQILTNLIYNFAAVGFVMLIALFFASRYFANRSIAPVKEAFYKQKQFIADASHELKTPLAVINTNTDVLLANREDTIRNQAKWLHVIKSETERMARLTGDLLYLTEMDDTRANMMFAKFSLSDAVENIILTMEAVIFEKQLSLDYSIEPGLTVYGSSEQIKQVIMILLDNAIKYSNPGGAIRLELKKQHNEAVLSVMNTGEGIAPEQLPRIFDRFYRTDTSRSRKLGGHGLGLAIAKSIIEQHKGKIYAKSTAGESTTFYVHLS